MYFINPSAVSFDPMSLRGSRMNVGGRVIILTVGFAEGFSSRILAKTGLSSGSVLSRRYRDGSTTSSTSMTLSDVPDEAARGAGRDEESPVGVRRNFRNPSSDPVVAPTASRAHRMFSWIFSSWMRRRDIMLKLFLDSKRLRVGDRADVSLALSLPFSEEREGFADWPSL